MSLDTDEFEYVSTLLRQQSGMVLEAGKEYLVETRLGPIAKQAGHSTVNELIKQLRRSPANSLHTSVVEALTTNETQFFRDIHPFEALRTNILPALIEKRSTTRRLDIWCAAASTGQEPYSLAMLMDDAFPQLSSWSVRCLASDISEEALTRAREGLYRQLEINRGLPEPMLKKYFVKQGANWQISDQLRRRIEYRNINLIAPWPSMPALDLIMMRNVLIYFNIETKQQILAKVRRVLKPDGYLFLGSAETTLNLDTDYKQVQIGRSVCYQLK